MTTSSIPRPYPPGRRPRTPIDGRNASAEMLTIHGEVEQRMERSFQHLVASARIHGLSWEEIGARLGQNHNTVRSRFVKGSSDEGEAGRP